MSTTRTPQIYDLMLQGLANPTLLKNFRVIETRSKKGLEFYIIEILFHFKIKESIR